MADDRQKGKRFYKIVAAVFGGLVLAIVLARIFMPLRPVKLVISKETTWLTEPLDDDGLVDYAKYLNDKHLRQIPLEKNPH